MEQYSQLPFQLIVGADIMPKLIVKDATPVQGPNLRADGLTHDPHIGFDSAGSYLLSLLPDMR